MNKTLVDREGITYDTARRHIAKAMRRARHDVVVERGWGGARDGAGRKAITPTSRRHGRGWDGVNDGNDR
jgi:hypothetical protein